MKTIIFKILLFGSIPIVLSGCGNRPKSAGQATETTTSPAMPADSAGISQPVNDSDNDFFTDAVNGGLMEVELGQYASEHAVDPRVKNFGKMMVNDHSAANQELKTIAAAKNKSLPNATVDPKHISMLTDLQKEKGADFDKKYIKSMVEDHEKDTEAFRKYAQNGNDAELKAFAAKTLPVLEMHLDSAKKIKDALK